MAIQFPMIDPTRTQFNKGIGEEIGTPIAQAILAAAERRKKQKEREEMKRYLGITEDLPNSALEKAVEQKTKPTDFGTMISLGNLQRGLTTDEEARQKLAREREGKSV